MGLFQTRIQILAIIQEMDMYTSTGQRALDLVESVHIAHTSVEVMANAVIPEG